MKFIRRFYGGWPQWYAEVDGGQVVYVRIRHGEVWIGLGANAQEAYDNADLVREGVTDYFGVSEALHALKELQEAGFYYVAPNKIEEYTDRCAEVKP